MAFTTLLPTSIGITLVATIAGGPLWPAVLAVSVGALGLLGSMGHLARPVRSPFSVLNWRQSWLSREILSAAAYWVLALGWMLAGWLLPGMALPLALCALAMGGVLIWVIARSYRMQPRPAWDGPEGVAELVAVLLVAGVPAGMVSLVPVVERWIGWVGVVAVLAGLLLQYWAADHRLRRLAGLPANTYNVAETIRRCQALRATGRVVTVLDGLALLGALVAAAGPRGTQPWFWGVALLAGLAAHLLARALFYAAPVQKRFVAKIRPPISREVVS
jgi:DMSO reductase anchor subunit